MTRTYGRGVNGTVARNITSLMDENASGIGLETLGDPERVKRLFTGMNDLISVPARAIGMATAALLVAACVTSTPTATSPLPGDATSDCTYGAPEPTPTAEPKTQIGSPSPDAVSSGSTPETPSEDVEAYPDLPPAVLPASVQAWRDAVVSVTVELASGRIRIQQGLIVAENAVLTVLDLTERIASLSVDVSGRGSFAAELDRFDPRTGAALLTVEVDDVPAAPDPRANVLHGEPVFLLTREQAGDEFLVSETYASPSDNAPDDILALRADYTPHTARGTVVVSADGTPIGLAGHGRRWYGQQIVLGRIGGTDLPAVLLTSALQLLGFGPQDAGITPAAVVYHGPGVNRHVDGPVTRGMLAEPVRARLEDVGETVRLENLGRHPRYVLRPNSGKMLELLYAGPQELRGPDGALVGSARYIVLWWDREGGAPDLVLCGVDREHLGAAFAARGLGSIGELMEGVPSSSPHSMVAARPLPTVRNAGNADDYQYPYVWELKTDRLAYGVGEEVALTFEITNISDWPARLDYVPPRVTIYSIRQERDVVVLPHGDSHIILQPRETASFSIEWDQVDGQGVQAAPGRYIARVQLANLMINPFLDWGPQADVVLK